MNTVHIYIKGPVGCGKSAIAGEIEILCKALGLSVSWLDGQSEKNMTGADWQYALDAYKPNVVIHEDCETAVERTPSGEAQSYRDANDMPMERAVLEREWLAMRLALSRPTPQPAPARAEGGAA